MSRLPKRLVPVAALLSIFVAALTVAVLAGWTQPLDDAVLARMVAMETPWLVGVSEILHHSGSVPFIFVVIAGGFGVLAARGRLADGLFWLAMVIVAAGLSELTKEIIVRPRPTSSLIIKTSFSYPSGHAMVSGAAIGLGMAAFASVLWPHRHRLFFAIGAVYAIAVAASSVYLRAHWLTDIVAGLAFGMAVLAIALLLWSRSLASPSDCSSE